MDDEFDHRNQSLGTIPEDDTGTSVVPSPGGLRLWVPRDSRSDAGESVTKTNKADIFEETSGLERQRRQAGLPAQIRQNDEVDPSPFCSKISGRNWLFLGVVVLALVAAIVTVSTTLNLNGNSTGSQVTPTDAPSMWSDDFLPTGSPTLSPSMQPSAFLTSAQLELQTFLATNVSSDVLDNSTACYQTWYWIAYEDPAELQLGNSPEWRIMQRFVAAHMYFSLNGGNWSITNYLNGDHECDWDGLECVEYQILQVKLDGVNLDGSLPSELGLLSGIGQLHVANNSLTGSIPEALWDLRNLSNVDLSNNTFAGQISTKLWKLPALLSFKVDHNLLSGNVPDLSGADDCPLASLAADFNQLTGTLPSSVWNLKNLFLLSLSDNRLTGELPGLPDGQQSLIRGLYLSHNKMQGSLPPSTGMDLLQNAVLHDNSFSSQIPESWFQLPNLTYLDLSENDFVGTIPQFPNSSKIEFLYLNNNSLSGPLPSNLPVRVRHAWFHFNNFSGTIPSSFGLGCPDLQKLRIQSNQLSGSIPLGVCDVPFMKLLESDCAISSMPFVNCSCCDNCF